MMIRATITKKPATAVLLRTNRRMISCRRVSRLGSASVGVGSASTRSLAVSNRCSVTAALAQPHSRIEDGNHDVGEDGADQHTDAGECGHRDGPVHVLTGDRADAVLTHSMEGEDDLREGGAGEQRRHSESKVGPGGDQRSSQCVLHYRMRLADPFG